jgi:hypothetical protein
MGTCMTNPVKSADARLANLRAALADLRNQLKECQTLPDPTQYETRLLAKAEGLLAQLGQELKKTKEETAGYGYEMDEFNLLSDLIRGYGADVQHILRTSGVRQKLISKLGADWTPKARADLEWFHGTYMDVAIKILDLGYLDANATGGAGKKFGPGTYFTQELKVTEGYGDCVFGINVADLKILTARDIPLGNPFEDGGLQVTPGKISEEELKKIRSEGNPCADLTKWAQANGYDAIEFTESTEGHILIVLKNIEVNRTNVVSLKDY